MSFSYQGYFISVTESHSIAGSSSVFLGQEKALKPTSGSNKNILISYPRGTELFLKIKSLMIAWEREATANFAVLGPILHHA